MGAEALCRGAATVIGIEQDSRACEVIRQNWQQVATPDQQFKVWRGDVRQRLRDLETEVATQPFDHIYFDPPYASQLYEPVLAAIVHHQLLAADGELAVEHATEHATLSNGTALAIPPGLALCRQKHYGATTLSFFSPSDV
jgi:16S rRNA (guanine(966)-N(2))-methyltransferase RsmD